MLTRKEQIRLDRVLKDYPSPPHDRNFVLRVIRKISASFNPATKSDIDKYLEQNGLPTKDNGQTYDLPDDL